MIIGRSLLVIAEDVMGTDKLPESQRSIRVVGICVGVCGLGSLAERRPKALGIIVRKRTKQLVQRRHGRARD
jgi:hypothetical protein